MSTFHEAMAHMGAQLAEHWARTGRPIAPMDQVDYYLCEDGVDVAIYWYQADGFAGITCFTPEHPGAPLPRPWSRHAAGG
jgi:hypothetical protein